MLRASRTSLFDLHSPCFISEGAGVPVKSQCMHCRPINKETCASGLPVRLPVWRHSCRPGRIWPPLGGSFTRSPSMELGLPSGSQPWAPPGALSSSPRSHAAVSLLGTGWMESARQAGPLAQVPLKVLTLCTGWMESQLSPWGHELKSSRRF